LGAMIKKKEYHQNKTRPNKREGQGSQFMEGKSRLKGNGAKGLFPKARGFPGRKAAYHKGKGQANYV